MSRAQKHPICVLRRNLRLENNIEISGLGPRSITISPLDKIPASLVETGESFLGNAGNFIGSLMEHETPEIPLEETKNAEMYQAQLFIYISSAIIYCTWNMEAKVLEQSADESADWGTRKHPGLKNVKAQGSAPKFYFGTYWKNPVHINYCLFKKTQVIDISDGTVSDGWLSENDHNDYLNMKRWRYGLVYRGEVLFN